MANQDVKDLANSEYKYGFSSEAAESYEHLRHEAPDFTQLPEALFQLAQTRVALADSAAAYPSTVRLDIAGLPANFMPLFAGGRTAFVPQGDQVVVHGGVSVEELIVPFVKVSYVIGTE